MRQGSPACALATAGAIASAPAIAKACSTRLRSGFRSIISVSLYFVVWLEVRDWRTALLLQDPLGAMRASYLHVLSRPEILANLAAQDLAEGRQRQLIAEHDLARHLETGKAGLAVRHEG